ncbi:MAG: bifunctional hydroxymethylpyrimidine kinase/phosphomethylpyrimidine kinase [Burkholderiales bacterium]|jgi:hydroxymethylpyrimidine/phosphomethylpyrimidine kinase|nr:bifunctional hydroxymethylpyrimidine kinase/phosphomethylpyrimidine kinase [Burkholderiales bacterium]
MVNEQQNDKTFIVLTIAGSDSGGGAGIQADLKTFSALGVYGASVLTALTAQNTQGVQGVFPVTPEFVMAQCDSVFGDLRIDSVKCGMLANAAVIGAVAASLVRYRPPVFVLDTVMVAKGGDTLLAPEAVRALREVLLPLADIVTPNLPEAAALLDTDIATDETAMRQQGRALLALGAKAVLMKGGHLKSGDSPDWLITPAEELRFAVPRVETRHTHGTGCTLSAALAALRPQRPDWKTTVQEAKDWLTQALMQADRLSVGRGIGPPHHFHRWW